MEHNFTQESRVHRTHRQGCEVIYRQTRWVCTCGFTSCWSTDGVRARREKDRHNLDGQLEHDGSPPWPERSSSRGGRRASHVLP